MNETETNKAVVKAYVEAMNAGDFDRLLTILAPDVRIQGVTGEGGLGFALPIWRQLHHSMNMHLEIQDMVSEDDRVAVLFRESGKWTGPFLDFKEPTGRGYELVALEWFEVKDRKIAARWAARDAASQARQVGFPVPAGSSAGASKDAA